MTEGASNDTERSPGPVRIAPSILASDFLHLGDEVRAVEAAGARHLHIDVMDGRFVPNITIGPLIVEAIRRATSMRLETHLMIVEPERYVAAFADAGADLITVHAEVSPHLYRTLQQIHEKGKLAGVAINPGTPLEAVEEVLDLADVILIMTVSPGFGGQKFISRMLGKIRSLRSRLDALGLTTDIAVDGGIDVETGPLVVAAGARVLVAGTAIYRSEKGISSAFEDISKSAARSLPPTSPVRQ